MKLKIELIVPMNDDLWGLNGEPEMEWFKTEVMKGENLHLISVEAGDSMEDGEIEIVKWEIIK